MATSEWLSLSDYSSEYGVSVSTLRRRIKSEKVEYSLRDGKYYLKDSPLGIQPSDKPETHETPTGADSLENRAASDVIADEAAPKFIVEQAEQAEQTEQFEQIEQIDRIDPGEFLNTANRWLDELKGAYKLILQEKEEQILQLHEELTDLKTLVRVLESENTRLKSEVPKEEPAPLENWLSELTIE